MTANRTAAAEVTYVVACGASKLGSAAPARELYCSPHFHYVLRAAEESAVWDQRAGWSVQVLILSAQHGLIDPTAVLEPYNTRLGDPEAITPRQLTAQARRRGLAWPHQVYALLPRDYCTILCAALRPLDVWPQDVFEGTGGIGEQRRVCRNLLTSSPTGRRTTGGEVSS
jgi:hypothetical protein